MGFLVRKSVSESVDSVIFAVRVDVFGVGGRVGYARQCADQVFAVGEDLESGKVVAFEREARVDGSGSRVKRRSSPCGLFSRAEDALKRRVT